MGQRRTARDSGTAALIQLADALTSVLIAPACAACSQPLEHPVNGPVCHACWQAVRPLHLPLCGQCGYELPTWRLSSHEGLCAVCERRRSAVDRARAVAEYDGPLRRIIHALKYEGRRGLARPLAIMLRDVGPDVLRGASSVVPVPLHPFRRLARGFNQASDLAALLPLPAVAALWRIRPTQPQEHLNATARRRNVQDAFVLSPLVTRHERAQLLHGHAVVLVDDVRTTGATLDQCAAVLKAAGVREVRALTVAIARPPGSPTSGRDSAMLI